MNGIDILYSVLCGRQSILSLMTTIKIRLRYRYTSVYTQDEKGETWNWNIHKYNNAIHVFRSKHWSQLQTCLSFEFYFVPPSIRPLPAFLTRVAQSLSLTETHRPPRGMCGLMEYTPYVLNKLRRNLSGGNIKNDRHSTFLKLISNSCCGRFTVPNNGGE